MLGLVPHVFATFAHEPLHGVSGALGVGQQPPLRLAAHMNLAVLGHRHDRRDEPVAMAVTDDLRHAILDVGDERIRGAEIDPYYLAHVSFDSTQRTQRTRRIQKTQRSNRRKPNLKWTSMILSILCTLC